MPKHAEKLWERQKEESERAIRMQILGLRDSFPGG